MSVVEELEGQARYVSLGKGPWWKKGALARAELKPPPQIRALLNQSEAIDLHSLANAFAKLNPADDKKFQQMLRCHAGTKVTDPHEIAVRDSLDYALAHLMLLELAVETGYLPLELIRDDARRELASLLWSSGAQQFICYYDYVTIEYLGRRVDIAGIRDVAPPPINPEASTRFAIFLAQFTDWVKDKALRSWLSFLDDYVEYEGEQMAFRSYLLGEVTTRSERFSRLLYGVQRFLLNLCNLFCVLKPPERAIFGLFYSYWMAKFFGYELEEDGYRRTTQQSWADIIRKHPDTLLPPTATDEARAAMRELLAQQMATIQEAWNATSELVAASAASKR
ncbi:MAG: hypothetical protein QM771_17120 [Nitrospira sp.]